MTSEPYWTLSSDQAELIGMAVQFIINTPEQTGEVTIRIEHGKLRFIQVAPSFRFNMHNEVTQLLHQIADVLR